jgi:hypothetical protein
MIYCGIETRCWATTAKQTMRKRPLLGNRFVNTQQYWNTHTLTDRWEGFMKQAVELGSGAMIYCGIETRC